MTLNEKLDIMLTRKRVRRVDFAESVGITYRAFAYYMNGTRKPRRAVLEKIAEKLEVSPEFLLNDKLSIKLTTEEALIKNISDRGGDTTEAASFLAKSRGLLAGNSLTEDDKTHLMRCLEEIYKDSLENSSK